MAGQQLSYCWNSVSEWIIRSWELFYFYCTFNFSSSRCTTPTSSVLFDGNIPTLTGLDGDMWASQLLTLQLRNASRRDIISDFTGTSNYTGVDRVELVMFNCPEWGVSVRDIQLLVALTLAASLSLKMTISPNITSCDSLVRVCISHAITEPVIALRFIPAPGSNRTYLAEMGFYGDSSACPPDTIHHQIPLHLHHQTPLYLKALRGEAILLPCPLPPQPLP